MFKEKYILDLLSGHLTQKGYASIVGSIASMARHYSWQKNIIVSDTVTTFWTDDDIKELTQQFFEWIVVNKKSKYINKVPLSYLGYYFTQMLISFVSNRIKEEQQKEEISFQKCQDLVNDITEENYESIMHFGKKYIKSSQVITESWLDELDDCVQYLSHYAITEQTKHYKPIVKLAIEDILLAADSYVNIDSLVHAVYNLLDQSSFAVNISDIESTKFDEEPKYQAAINIILAGISAIDAKIIIGYLFSDKQKVSLSEIAKQNNLPKSTVHKKVEDFKKKIFSTYMPDNENDGIIFLQKLAEGLDELVK